MHTLKTLLPFLVSSSTLLACSGAGFEVVPGTDAQPDLALETESPTDAAPDTISPDSDAGCPANACGGCSVLSTAPGTSCGVCASGKFECDGKDAVKCNDPVTSPAPGTSCGTCKSRKYACAPDGKSTTCGLDDANGCGGCAILAPALGTSCGKCGSGKMVCDGTDAVKCDDPVTTPAPKTKCGTCSTLEYVCASDSMSTKCPGDDKNACGGCGTLAGTPETACGSCGIWKCDPSLSSVTCKEATPTKGTVCGICSTSSYACTSPGVTTCSKPDDTVSGTDTLDPDSSSNVWSASPSVLIGFNVLHKQSIGAITLKLAVGDSGSGAAGTIDLRLFQGVLGSPSTVDLGTVTIDPSSLGSGVVTATFKFTSPVPSTPVSAGTSFHIHFADNSPRYNFDLRGGNSGTIVGDPIVYLPDGTKSTARPYLVVDGKGCYSGSGS